MTNEEMMNEYPFVERIALEQYNYIEVKALTVDDLINRATQVKTRYADRLFKSVPPAQYQSSAPFPQGMQMQESGMTCEKCGAIMNLQQKTSKKTGKPYSAYFCPNGSMQDPHPMKFPPR